METCWGIHTFQSPVQEFLFLLQLVVSDGLKDQELSSKRKVYQNVGGNARLAGVALVIRSQQQQVHGSPNEHNVDDDILVKNLLGRLPSLAKQVKEAGDASGSADLHQVHDHLLCKLSK